MCVWWWGVANLSGCAPGGELPSRRRCWGPPRTRRQGKIRCSANPCLARGVPSPPQHARARSSTPTRHQKSTLKKVTAFCGYQESMQLGLGQPLAPDPATVHVWVHRCWPCSFAWAAPKNLSRLEPKKACGERIGPKVYLEPKWLRYQ